MQQANLVQDFYPTSSDGNFELMFWRSGRYQALGQRQVQRSGRGVHNSGCGNCDCGNNSCNRRVDFFHQVQSNRTPVPGIYITNIDAECYYCHFTGRLSNNCLKYQLRDITNVEQVAEALEEELSQEFVRFVLDWHIMMMTPYLLFGCFLMYVLPLVSVRIHICSRTFGNDQNSIYLLQKPMAETKHSMKLASMKYFQLRSTSIYIQWPTSLNLRIWPMYLES